MALVLAIEPDLRQAAILKRIVKEQVKADLVVVETRDAAMEAIGRAVPDVLLLSALMSPRDEDELIQHLRSLDNAEHLQTHTIPQLASSLEDRSASKGGGLLRAFRRKKDPAQAAPGCDPDLFADEMKTFLKYAAEKKEERRALIESGHLAANSAVARPSAAESPEPAEADSSWNDPFAWNPTAPARPSVPAPLDAAPAADEPSDPWATDYRARVLPTATTPEPVVQPDPDSPGEDPVDALVAAAVEAAAPIVPPSHGDTSEVASPLLDAIDVTTPHAVEAALPEEPVAVVAHEPEPIVMPEPIAVTAAADPVEVEPEPVIDEPAVAEPEAVVASAELPPIVAEEIPDAAHQPEIFVPEPMIAAAESAFTSASIEQAVPIDEPIAPETEPAEAIAAQSEPAAPPRTLGPLATWVRFEAGPARSAERTTTDELRDLMAHLAIPTQVAGVTYAQGCRIRRVRVPGGRDRRKTAVPGPVILSRRQLAEQRQTGA